MPLAERSEAGEADVPGWDVLRAYLVLGLRLDRHVEGIVDAYYGPAVLSDRVAAEPVVPAGRLREDARALIAVLDDATASSGLDAGRRRWLRAQVVGLEM